MMALWPRRVLKDAVQTPSQRLGLEDLHLELTTRLVSKLLDMCDYFRQRQRQPTRAVRSCRWSWRHHGTRVDDCGVNCKVLWREALPVLPVWLLALNVSAFAGNWRLL